MRCLILTIMVAAAGALATGAAAYVVVPAENPAGFHVVIEGDLGDHVPLASLPPPYDRFEPETWHPAGLVFRWRYYRSSEEGEAILADDGDGRARVTFGFAGPALADGDTVAATAVLVDGQGTALHTIHAYATVEGETFGNGDVVTRADAPLALPPEAHASVAGLILFNMKYYGIQRRGPDEVEASMRRAVRRVTGGAGTEQWLVAGTRGE